MNDAEQMLRDLAEPVQAFANNSLAALNDHKRALVAAALERGAQLVVMIEVTPDFDARLVLDDGKQAIELARLCGQADPESLN